MKTTKLIFAALLMMASSAYAQKKFVGGDISNLTSNEACNPTYYDFDGNKCPALELFKQQDLNAMRVRLHVTPSDFPDNDPNCCQDLEYVKSLGKRNRTRDCDKSFTFRNFGNGRCSYSGCWHRFYL